MLDSPSHSDDDLLRLISSGNETAFLTFYRKHQGPVFRFALQMSGKAEVAEEVTQDVFMVVMKAAKQFDPGRGSASGYLYGIARNLVRRSLEREKPYLTVLDDPGNEYSGHLADDHDIAFEFAQAERVESLRRAVLALPPAYREVVVLCDLHELDYADAAVVLGCAIGTIRSRLHRARALLMEKMRAAEKCTA
jgi:RNA polymerase sigma-70 factor, ECF subfamily